MNRISIFISVGVVAGVITAAVFLPSFFSEEAERATLASLSPEERNQFENNLRVQTVAEALKKFHQDCGFYPSNSQGLEVLLQKASNCKKWGPKAYLDLPESLTDFYGNKIQYKLNGRFFIVKSLGKDNKSGGVGENSDYEREN